MTTIDLLKKIYFYVGLKERLLWGLSVFLATVSAGIGLFLPTQLNLLVQKFENFNFNDMIILVLLFFLQSIIMYVSLYVLGKIGEYIILQLRKESALSLLQSEVFNLESTTWASRVIYNPGFFSDLISRQLPTLITNTLQVSLTIIILFYLNFKITILIISGIFIVVCYSIVSGKILSQIQIRFQEFLSQTNQQLSDILGRLGLIKVNNTIEREFEFIKNSVQEIYRLSMTTLRFGILNQMGHQLLFILLVLLVLCIIVNDIKSGVAQLSSITLYIMYCFQLVAPLLAISDELTGINKSKEIMLEYMNRFYHLPSNSEQAIYPQLGERTKIEILNYSNPFNKTFIKSLCLDEGKVYQLKGSSGVGKTTLLNSILGLVHFSEGSIKVTLKSEDILYNRIAYYQSQQQLLVNRSIRENLSYSRHIADTEILDVLNKFGLCEELKDEDILNLIVTENTLSKGQISRLGLAREYLKQDSEIVVLDEPFAHLDKVNSMKIDKMFRDRFNNSILIIVSHTNDYYNKKDYIIEMV